MRDNKKFALPHKMNLTGAPEQFSVTQGDNSGEVDLQWDPLPGANSYILQICLHNVKHDDWIKIDIITKSSYTVSGLKAGRKYYFRISAVNSSGEGPWSKIICKLVQ